MNKNKFLIIMVLVLVLCGCSSKKEIESTNTTNINGKDYTKSINCSILKNDKIKYILDSSDKSYLVTDSNKIYEVNFNKLYKDTNENCTLYLETTHELKGMDSNLLYDNNNDIVDISVFGKNTEVDNNWSKYDSWGDEINYDYDMMTNSIYKKDFNYFIKKDNTLIKTSFDKDEEVETYYDINDNNYFIKTNKAVYQLIKTKTNKEECEKYTDVKCKYSYSFIKRDDMTKIKDDIALITMTLDQKFKGNSDWFYVVYLKNGKTKAFNN